MTLTLTLDGVTFGDLYEFVDAARAARVPAEERVRCIGSDDKGDRFELELDPSRRPAGSARAAARAVAGGGPTVDDDVDDDADTGDRGRHRGASQPSANRMTDTVRALVRDEEDVDRLISVLKDMRKFLR